MRAQIVPFSSVVGLSVLLTDKDTGQAIGQLRIMSHDYSKEYKEAVTELAQRVCDAINRGQETAKPLVPPVVVDTLVQKEISTASGFTGDACRVCGSFAMVRTGTCVTCQSCGSNEGCG